MTGDEYDRDEDYACSTLDDDGTSNCPCGGDCWNDDVWGEDPGPSIETVAAFAREARRA